MAASSPERWDAVDAYICERLLGEDPVLEAVLAANVDAGLPPIDVSLAQARMLELFVRMAGAERVLEIGALGGLSAIALARGLSATGRLVTLEVDPHHAQVARANIERAGFADRIDVRTGPALDALRAMREAGERAFDLVFVDADKENYAPYLDAVMPLVRAGSTLVFDNVVREGEVLDPASADPKVPGTRALYDALNGRADVRATAVQTVGTKKWDGFLLAVVAPTA